MIPLRVPIEPLPIDEPMVVRLRLGTKDEQPIGVRDACLISEGEGVAEFDLAGFSLRVRFQDTTELDGDVLLILPNQKAADRLIRASSQHNTFLVTERCDQLCVMCSQPPKKHHVGLFPQFEEAALLAPRNAWLGVSGGEPTLYKRELFRLISDTVSQRPDIHFHVLTNAQHFTPEDLDTLSSTAFRNVLWGIPIYSADLESHDKIVGKGGAFDQLKAGLSILARAGARIELRTVALNSNRNHLSGLAQYVSLNIPFVDSWAIMQLESIGFGRMNWSKEFWDTSADFAPLAAALDVAQARGLEVCLYNFPACTVPEPYRHLAKNTISDWKQKYLDICETCSLKEGCGGFFEWYSEKSGFVHLGGHEKADLPYSVASGGRTGAQQG